MKMTRKALHEELRRPLSGMRYFWTGFWLVLLKGLLDRFVAIQLFDQPWEGYWNSLQHYYLLGDGYGSTAALFEEGVKVQGFHWVLLAMSLPFMFFGLALTARRLRTLHVHPWQLIFFFVPYLQIIFFVTLAAAPEQAKNGHWKGDWFSSRLPRGSFSAALGALILTGLFGGAVVALSVYVFKSYGGFLFVGLPFAQGFLATLLYEPEGGPQRRNAIKVGQLSVVLLGACLLAFAIEGVFCILMAAPLACFLAWLGSELAWELRTTKARNRLALVIVLLTPGLVAFEGSHPQALDLYEVRSEVLIQAPAEKVWEEVVAFKPLDPPTEWYFKAGIAYPTHAVLKGRGVGAVRECHFSTGPFVEPITVWDEPRRLAFDVRSQPQPMKEFSPYNEVHAPHLDGYLDSRKGQFELIPQADGQVLLRGTTWYTHALWPGAYWKLYSDAIIHKIHLRVLEHIKTEAETGA